MHIKVVVVENWVVVVVIVRCGDCGEDNVCSGCCSVRRGGAAAGCCVFALYGSTSWWRS